MPIDEDETTAVNNLKNPRIVASAELSDTSKEINRNISFGIQ